MNKQAQKLKAKRRAEREAAKMEKVNKVWEDISQYSESNGLPVMKKTKEQMLKVYNARKQVDAKVLNMAAVIALLCSLITLYKEYNCDKEKLLEYSSRLRKFIINIAKIIPNIIFPLFFADLYHQGVLFKNIFYLFSFNTKNMLLNGS